jgi:uncharacterized ion transporter superfamily protein YfcC
MTLIGMSIDARRVSRYGERQSSTLTGSGYIALLLPVLAPVGVAYVMFFAQRFGALKQAPVATAAVAGSGGGVLLGDGGDGGEPPVTDVAPLTGSQKIVLVIFGLAFAIMIYGFVPWNDVWHNVFDAEYPLPTFSNFYFTEASMLFIVAAVLIGVISRMGEEGTVSTIVSGAADFLSAGLVIVLARGVTVIMRNSYITDTILHWMETAVNSLSGTGSSYGVGRQHRSHSAASSRGTPLVMPSCVVRLRGRERGSPSPPPVGVGLGEPLTPTSAVIMGGLARQGRLQHLHP